MICPTCRKANLPGGVRCSYCGAPFPQALDFEVEGVSPATERAAAQPGPSAASSAAAAPGNGAAVGRRAGGLAGAIVILLIKGKSLLTMLKLGSFLPTLLSMLVFVKVYCFLFPWQFALGLAVCILVHEMGHVITGWRHGLKQTPPMFLPGFGALIQIRKFPDNPAVEAEIGAGGPVAGFLASAVCAGIGFATGSNFWQGLAQISFAINLANMAPFWQLDGAHILSAVSPDVLNVAIVCVLLYALKLGSGLLWLVLLLAFFERLRRPTHGRHDLAPPRARAMAAAVFVALCIALDFGSSHTGAGRNTSELAAQHPHTPTAASSSRQSQLPTAPGVYKITPTGPAAGTSTAPGAKALRVDGLRSGQADEGFLDDEIDSGLLLVLGTLLSLLICRLLAGAAGSRLRFRGLGFLSWMSGCGAAVLAFSVWVSQNAREAVTRLQSAPLTEQGPALDRYLAIHDHAFDLRFAYAAAMGAALVYAIYAAVTNRKGARLSASGLTWRALGWASAGALLLAYWKEDSAVLAALMLCGLVFYARRPWLVPSLAARLLQPSGDALRAIRLREMALRLRPDPASAAEQWRLIARSNLALHRAEAAFKAAGTAEELGDAPDPATAEAVDAMLVRGLALVRMDRFPEALTVCEQLLRAPAEDRVGPLRVLLVNTILSEMALYRGWPDEALARADAALKMLGGKTAGSVAPLAAAGRLLRAGALVDLGRSQEAVAECDTALKIRRSPALEATAALVRSQAAYNAGDFATSEAAAASGLRRVPGTLPLEYWRARALCASGRAAEGQSILRSLAETYPHDRWGKL